MKTHARRPVPTPAMVSRSPRGTPRFSTGAGTTAATSAVKRILLGLSLVITPSVLAGEPPWIPLFNGRDFTGWKLVGPTNLASAEIREGAMVLRQRINTAEHTFVASEGMFRDFILELDLRDDPGFNSGILLRCVEAPGSAKVRLNAYQVKIDNTPRAWTGGIFDDFGDSWRWLHDLADNEPGRAAFKLGEWAHFRIEAIGETIKVWVNGVPTCHLVDGKYREGRIAFKIHSLGDRPNDTLNAIRLKNIRIVTEQPERYAQPMSLPPRRAPSTPGKFDRLKRPRRRRRCWCQSKSSLDSALRRQVVAAAGLHWRIGDDPHQAAPVECPPSRGTLAIGPRPR